MAAAPFGDPTLEPFGDTGVWCHPATAALAAGDDDAGYEQLATALAAIDDRSVGAPALAALRTMGLAAAAFDASAGNVLRPLTHLWRGRRVLELGAGGGAVTRLLAEQAAHVTALEPRLAKARLLRARTADCPHVDVVCATLEALPAHARFDVVLGLDALTGLSAADALAWALHARRLVRPTGVLVVGAANPLASAAAALRRGPATPAGPRALGQLLGRVGLLGHRAFAVFPCLSACRTVLTEEGTSLAAEGLATLWPELARPPEPPTLFDATGSVPPGAASTARWLGQALPVPPMGHHVRGTIDVGAAASAAAAPGPSAEWWQRAHAAGLLFELAPAHLVVGRPTAFCADDGGLAHPADVAYSFATWRPKQLVKQSVWRLVDGHVEVLRARLYPALRPEAGALVQRLDDEAVPAGEVLQNELSRTLCTPGWSAADVARTLRPWAALLERHERHGRAGRRGVLSGHLIDVAPSNVAVMQGQAEAFSLEWDLGQDVPLEWVLFRGLCRALARQDAWAPPAAEQPRHMLPLIQSVLRHWQVDLSVPQALALAQQERQTFGVLAAVPLA